MRLSTLCLLTCVWLLTGCFGSDEEAATSTSDASGGALESFATDMFELEVPAAWSQVDAAQLVAPATGVIEVAFRSDRVSKAFANNLIILSEHLERIVTSADYSAQAIFLATRKYASFDLKERSSLDFSDGADKSMVYVFEAQYNPASQKALFFQTARVCGNKAYLLTIGVSLPLESSRYASYRDILATFNCKT